MTAVFVHGVPDTEQMWNRLTAAIDRSDVVRLSLPGFGTDVPAGWTATKEEYSGWLESQLEQFAEPVDLVGHDWGAILSQRVASLRPDLVRTLACGSGPLDDEYEWHPMAQAWQTSEVQDITVDQAEGLHDRILQAWDTEDHALMLTLCDEAEESGVSPSLCEATRKALRVQYPV